jgi:hypothetical protein
MPAPHLPLIDDEARLPPRRSRRPLEPSSETDELRDYVLERYPPTAPQEGKLRAVNLLHESFALAGVDEEGGALVDSLRAGLGHFRTVWGVKHDREQGAPRGWELYFYDWQRVHADLGITSLARLLAPHLRLDAAATGPLPWHMLSVAFSVEDLRERRAVPLRLYVDMRSYRLEGGSFTFENIYTFHDPRAEIDEVMRRLRASVHLDLERDRLSSLIPPALFRCHRICVANKRDADALYFSRVATPTLLAFLRLHGYPRELADFVHAERARLDHLLWDVGIDFRSDGGRATVRRTGFYGSF